MPKCKSNQDLNPNTNRCIKKGGKVWQKVFGSSGSSGSKSPKKKSVKSPNKGKSVKGSLKPCKSDQDRSPLTNRCVKRGGAAWKKAFGDGDVIVEKKGKSPKKTTRKAKKPVKKTKKKAKDCGDGKVESPTSGRCIKIGGAAYNKAFGVNKSPKKSPKKSPVKKTKKTPVRRSKGLGKVYGIYEAQYYVSDKYNMKVLFLGDSHTSQFTCPGGTSAPDMIEQQVVKAEPKPVDVFLEIPYIFRHHGSSMAVGGFMGDLYLNMRQCFEWAKNYCDHPNLRAHYVDTRREELSQKYFEFERWIVHIFFKHNYNAATEWERYKNDKELMGILKTKASLVKFMKGLLNYPKLKKQLDNIEDPKIKRVIKKHITHWTTSCARSRNIDFSIMRWPQIVKKLDQLRDGYSEQVLNDNHYIVHNLYYSLASYSGIVMDVYTIGRMFRTYRDVPGKFSGRAENTIVYAGSQHTHRYQRVLSDLGFKKIREQFGGFSAGRLSACVDMGAFPNPLF
jgi:hypothetical protein